jgi:ADP-heptose:LPS heptosyltransferase
MSDASSISERALRAARRLAQRARRAGRKLSGKPLRVHIESRWRLGDEVMAIAFFRLVRRAFPDADITVSANYPALLDGETSVRVDNARGEFDCDRYVFARDDARCVPRLRHLCRLHRIPFHAIEPEVRVSVEPPNIPRRPGIPLVACSCGAGWTCKSWPPDYQARLPEALRSEGIEADLVCVGRGCPKVGVGLDFTESFAIEETAAILARCDAYVGPDSGLVHLAAAVGTPAVGLFGPVTPDAAFGRRAQLLPVLAPVDCQGCWTDGRMRSPGWCPLGIEGDDPSAFPCMRALGPELAARALRRAHVLEEA